MVESENSISSLQRRNPLEHPGDQLCRLNPIARVLLQGLYDENSEFHKLSGMWHILQKIWRNILCYWKLHIKYTNTFSTEDIHDMALDLGLLDQDENYLKDLENSYLNKSGLKHFSGTNTYITFPEQTGLNINMMPFVMHKNTFRESCLPKYLKTYWKEVIKKCPIDGRNIGKVGYLTIQESFVDANTFQRKPGIHTEKPAKRLVLCETEQGKDNTEMVRPRGGGGYSIPIEKFWGQFIDITLHDGIFMAFTKRNSCRIWDCQIMNDDLIGEQGDVEHLRQFLSDHSVTNISNYIYWLTDRTPHEYLALEQGSYNQFFKLVTSKVSFWDEDHCTKNPLGVVPDPNITKIVRGSKLANDDKIGI